MNSSEGGATFTGKTDLPYLMSKRLYYRTDNIHHYLVSRTFLHPLANITSQKSISLGGQVIFLLPFCTKF